MTACNRCDWRSDTEAETRPREQLAEHATDSGHPVCVVCPHSLTEHETQTCEHCLTHARELLSGIVTMWAELPDHLGQLRGKGIDSGPHGSGDRPLPGGDVLVLMAPGNEGGAARRLTSEEQEHLDTRPIRWWLRGAVGPLTALQWSLSQNEAEGREHAVDNRPTDAPAVAWALASWVMDWGGPVSGSVPALAGYLEVRARWAANSHPAFDEFHTDLRSLHARLEQATGRSERRERAPADCFDCGGALERLITDNGQADHWTCRRCRRQYDWHTYLLAVRARLEDAS